MKLESLVHTRVREKPIGVRVRSVPQRRTRSKRVVQHRATSGAGGHNRSQVVSELKLKIPSAGAGRIAHQQKSRRQCQFRLGARRGLGWGSTSPPATVRVGPGCGSPCRGIPKPAPGWAWSPFPAPHGRVRSGVPCAGQARNGPGRALGSDGRTDADPFGHRPAKPLPPPPATCFRPWQGKPHLRNVLTLENAKACKPYTPIWQIGQRNCINVCHKIICFCV